MAMSVETTCARVESARIAVAATQRNLMEHDLIVPDVKPDMGRILHVDACPRITHVETSAGMVTAGGIIEYNVIYRGEKPEDGKVTRFTSTPAFTFSYENPEILPDLLCSVACETEHLEADLKNGRKLSISLIVSANIRLSRSTALEIPVDVTGLEEIQTLTGSLTGNSCFAVLQNKADIQGQVPVPNGKPAARDLLYHRARIKNCQCDETVEGVVMNGVLDLVVFYVSDDEDSSFQVFESEISFSATAGDPARIEKALWFVSSVQLEQVSCSIGEDSDGDTRMIQVEASAFFEVEGYAQRTLVYLEDAYSLSSPIQVKKEQAPLEMLHHTGHFQISGRDLLSPGKDMPEISEVLHAWCIPMITSSEITDGRLSLEGYFEVVTV
ncbi:MAG TPA: hypothetical protein DD727_09400 [Clostridiales bacterium]|nr:hypothetical protein [Clostridiales bacterium]